MSSRRVFSTIAAVFAALLFFAGPANAAGSAHFIKQATTASLSGVNLVVQFKEAGLPSGAQETIRATADLSATYQCVNGGGKNPADPKKTTVDTTVSTSGTFTAGKNGNVTGTLTLQPPAPADALDCPAGQTATLTTVTWSNIRIDDLTSGASLAISGTFSAGAPVGRGNN